VQVKDGCSGAAQDDISRDRTVNREKR